jgi:site-specific DNA recombinase
MGLGKLMKVGSVIYCRVSTKEQASNLSLEVQEEKCRAYCSQNKWEVTRVFRDAESAKTVNRTAFQEMLEFCGLNKKVIAAVVVYDGSRFSRETMDALTVEAFLNAKDIVVRSATQPFDESPEGGLIKTLIYAYGTYDNKLRAKRTIDGMQKAIQKGLWVHKPPLGYVNVLRATEDSANIAPDPEKAPLIRHAFDLYATGRYEKNEVLEKVTSMGLRGRGGQCLSPQSFSNMICNPVYAGWIVSSWGLRARGRFEPIVSEETYQRSQVVSESRRVGGASRGSLDHEFPLRGLVRCGTCGTPLTGSFSTGSKGGKYPYYFCPRKECPTVSIRRDSLHIDFTILVEQLRPREELWPVFKAILKEACKTKHEEQEETSALAAKRIAELDQLKDKLVRGLMDGRLKQYLFDEQMEKVEAQLSLIEAEEIDPLESETELDDLIEFTRWVLDNAGTLWNAAEYDKQLRLQAALCPAGVMVTDGELRTPASTSFFREFDANLDDPMCLASPEGFEPSLPP